MLEDGGRKREEEGGEMVEEDGESDIRPPLVADVEEEEGGREHCKRKSDNQKVVGVGGDHSTPPCPPCQEVGGRAVEGERRKASKAWTLDFGLWSDTNCQIS